MFEKLLNQKALNIACDVACLIRDREGFLDQFDVINLSCSSCIVSGEMNQKLHAKAANIACSETTITEYQGEFIQVPAGEMAHGADFAGKFVIVSGDLILREGAMHTFENVQGAVVTGTVYYPQNYSQELLEKVRGEKRAYPLDAHILVGSQDLESLVSGVPAGEHRVWVAGEVSALKEPALRQASQRGLTICCDHLFIMKGLYEIYQALFECEDIQQVPDGYTVTGPMTLNEATSVLYGTKLYIRGPLLLEERSREYLGEFESILVKGRASMPVSCAKAFKAVGQADSYRLYEGRLYSVNGWETFSHERLKTMVDNGEKMTLSINGFAVFSKDVTPRDIEAIASLECNGFILLPGAAQGALSQCTEAINGFTMDYETAEQMTGMPPQELVESLMSGGSTGNGNISTEVYMLV